MLKVTQSDLLLIKGEGGLNKRIVNYLSTLRSKSGSSFDSITIAKSTIRRIIYDSTAKSILLYEVNNGAHILIV